MPPSRHMGSIQKAIPLIMNMILMVGGLTG